MTSRISAFRMIALALVAGSAVLFSGVFGAVPQKAQAQTETPPPARTITVVGAGSVYTSPDVSYLSVGIDIQNVDLSAALKEADTKINAILAALKKAEIPDADIQTVQYSIFREGGYGGPSTGQPQQLPYHVVNVVRVTVRTLSKVGDILNVAVTAGANVVNSVEFGVKDTQASESKARKAALDNAKGRASELATSIGATLGDVVRIEETGNYGPVGKFSAATEGLGGGGGIVGGSLEVSVNLLVTYQIK